MRKSWWYTTIILCSSVKDPEDDTFVCDESIYLFRAATYEDAFVQATRIGKSQEHAYKNVYDETVAWQFLGLTELEKVYMNSVEKGIEIHSRIFMQADITSFTFISMNT